MMKGAGTLAVRSKGKFGSPSWTRTNNLAVTRRQRRGTRLQFNKGTILSTSISFGNIRFGYTISKPLLTLRSGNKNNPKDAKSR